MAITYVRCLFNSSINKYIFMILLFNSHGVISCNTPWTRELLDAICPYAADPLCCSGGCIWAIETSDHQVMSAHPQNLISKQSGPQGGMADHHTIPMKSCYDQRKTWRTPVMVYHRMSSTIARSFQQMSLYGRLMHLIVCRLRGGHINRHTASLLRIPLNNKQLMNALCSINLLNLSRFT